MDGKQPIGIAYADTSFIHIAGLSIYQLLGSGTQPFSFPRHWILPGFGPGPHVLILIKFVIQNETRARPC